MKVADMVRVNECLSASGKPPNRPCECFFCGNGSNRIGLVTEELYEEVHGETGWLAVFDVGEWAFWPPDVSEGDVEVISESR